MAGGCIGTRLHVVPEKSHFRQLGTPHGRDMTKACYQLWVLRLRQTMMQRMIPPISPVRYDIS